MVNLHFSLLPRWRGAAPVERAVLAGDAETGVCLMAARGGARHGAGLRLRAHGDRARREGRGAAGPARCAGDAPARRVARRRARRPRSRRRAKPPTQPRSTRRRSSSTGASLPSVVHRTVRLGRAWTTFRGARLQVLDALPVEVGPAAGTIDGVVIGCAGGTGLELVTVSPRVRAPSRRRRGATGPGRRRGSGWDERDEVARAPLPSKRSCGSRRGPTPTSSSRPSSGGPTSTNGTARFVTELVYGDDPHAPGLRLVARAVPLPRGGR